MFTPTQNRVFDCFPYFVYTLYIYILYIIISVSVYTSVARKGETNGKEARVFLGVGGRGAGVVSSEVTGEESGSEQVADVGSAPAESGHE